jgi:hypothetical protein
LIRYHKKRIFLSMRILSQSAPFSYPLLPAPAPVLMLPTPTIAGLLPAPRPQITVEKRKQTKTQPSRVFRSPAEWRAADAELAAVMERAMEAINAARQGVYYA